MNIKKTMKVLTAALVAGAAMLMPLGAWAKTQTEIVGDLKWSYTVDKSVATITGVERTSVGDRVEGTVTVPGTLGGHPVTVIGYRAFHDQEFITGAVLPEGITILGEYCFSGCKRLTTLGLPSTVRTVAHEAFGGCSTRRQRVLRLRGVEEPDAAIDGPDARLRAIQRASARDDGDTRQRDGNRAGPVQGLRQAGERGRGHARSRTVVPHVLGVRGAVLGDAQGGVP